jgi:hypothetical protein
VTTVASLCIAAALCCGLTGVLARSDKCILKLGVNFIMSAFE